VSIYYNIYLTADALAVTALHVAAVMLWTAWAVSACLPARLSSVAALLQAHRGELQGAASALRESLLAVQNSQTIGGVDGGRATAAAAAAPGAGAALALAEGLHHVALAEVTLAEARGLLSTAASAGAGAPAAIPSLEEEEEEESDGGGVGNSSSSSNGGGDGEPGDGGFSDGDLLAKARRLVAKAGRSARRGQGWVAGAVRSRGSWGDGGSHI
jgi:hypothetical protein